MNPLKFYYFVQSLVDQYSDPPPPPSITPATLPPDSVAVCRRPSGLGGIEKYTGSPDHWRVLTPIGYLGEAPIVPGTSYAKLPLIHVTNEPDGMDGSDAKCVPAAQVEEKWAQVDVACVEKKLSAGIFLGRWIPMINDCHTTVADALDACIIPTEQK